MLIRDATPDDARAIAAIGTVGFARVHEPLLGTDATRAVVEQTYAAHAVAASIQRCDEADDAHFLVAEDEEGRVVGYLHFDSFAGEPELRRIYVDPDLIGAGAGRALLEELHARIGPDGTYILMTAGANEGARRFYERNGLTVERHIPDGNAFYRDNMGVEFPPDSPLVPAVVMRRGGR